MTSQFVIEVQPLFIRNSFQTVFCLRALVSIEIPFVQTEVGLEIHVRAERIADEAGRYLMEC